MINVYHRLFHDKLLDAKQYDFLNAIDNNSLVSVYYDLRLMLYLGIMLFTSGIGYFVYQNMGELWHYGAMLLLSVAILVGFYFINKFSVPYSTRKVIVDHAYIDYILILTALLVIALFTYIQVYFDLVEVLIHWSSLISAAVFFFLAYRYDNKALLAMGIVAFAAGIGLSISLVGVKGNVLFGNIELYLISIYLGITLLAAGQVSDIKQIKAHYKHTYQQFGLLLFYGGSLMARFDNHSESLYGFILLPVAAFVSYHTWRTKQLSLFLYSNAAAYISITALIFMDLDLSAWYLLYYIPFSLIAYPLFLVRKKEHFAHE